MLTDFSLWRVAPALQWQESFALWLHREGRMPKTVAAYLQDMRHLGRWYEARHAQTFSPDLLTRVDVQSYFEWQSAAKAKAKSRNRRLASMRVMAQWAIGEGLLSEDPTAHQQRVKEKRLPRRAKNSNEIQSLATVSAVGAHLKRQTQKYSVLGLRDRAMWSLFINAALRIHEIAQLDVADLNFEEKTIRVIGKGDVDGDVTMADELEKDLRAWLACRPQGGIALLTDWDGERITTGQLRRRLKDIGAKAGIDVDPHDLRHSSIERVGKVAKNNGLSNEQALDVMQTHARHADKRTTLEYQRASFDDIIQAVNGAAGMV